MIGGSTAGSPDVKQSTRRVFLPGSSDPVDLNLITDATGSAPRDPPPRRSDAGKASEADVIGRSVSSLTAANLHALSQVCGHDSGDKAARASS